MIESIASVFLHILCRIAGKTLTAETEASFMQFVKFGIVGVSNTVLSYVIYVCCLLFLKNRQLLEETGYLAAQAVSFFITVLWAFYWNDRAVFQTSGNRKRSIWKTMAKTYVSYSFTGLFLSSALLVVWVHIGIPEIAAPAVNLVVTVPLNFIINKFWTFRNEGDMDSGNEK